MNLEILAVMVVRFLLGLDDSLLLGVAIVDMGNLSLVTIKDPSNLLQSRTLGFDVEEVNEDEFDGDPDLIVRLASFCEVKWKRKCMKRRGWLTV